MSNDQLSYAVVQALDGLSLDEQRGVLERATTWARALVKREPDNDNHADLSDRLHDLRDVWLYAWLAHGGQR